MRSSINRHGINYLPFDALEGYKEALELTLKRRNKIKKPVLSCDMYNQINENIIKAFKDYLKIKVTYYNSGIIDSLEGRPLKLDRYLYLDSKAKIKKDDVLNVEIL